MKIILVFPPQFDSTMPNLALPCLTAALRAAGHEVLQKDLNITAYDTFLSRRELEKASRKIRTNYHSMAFLGANQAEIQRLLGIQGLLIREVEDAKRVFRSLDDFYEYDRYLAAKKILEDSLKFIAMPYLHSDLSLGSARMLYSFDLFKMYYSPDSTVEVLKAVRDPEFNLYLDFYLEYIIPEFIRESPSVVGISFASRNQVIPGLTLAYLLKKHLKNIHIVIGGTHFTVLQENLARNQQLFSLFDSVILYEGEVALVELVNCLDRGTALSSVPNLIYQDSDHQGGFQIRVNPIQRIERLDELATPDFEGLPLDLYLSPLPVLPIYAGRGCYWGKCVFCNFFHTCDGSYRRRGGQQISSDLQKIQAKHDCRWFSFVDEAIPPDDMKQIAAEIIAKELSLNWFTYARFEKELNRDLAEQLATSGCRALFFGLESGSPRVLAKMVKGVHPALMKETLAATNAAGILNQITFIVGFPTETQAEAKETLKFILRRLDHISTIQFGTFRLGINSKIYIDPVKYQIEKVIPAPEHDLALGCNYEIKLGLSPKDALKTARRFEEILGELDLPPIMNSHYILFASHYQTSDLRQLTAIPDEQADFDQYKVNQLRKARKKAAALFKDPTFLK